MGDLRTHTGTRTEAYINIQQHLGQLWTPQQAAQLPRLTSGQT